MAGRDLNCAKFQCCVKRGSTNAVGQLHSPRLCGLSPVVIAFVANAPRFIASSFCAADPSCRGLGLYQGHAASRLRHLRGCNRPGALPVGANGLSAQSLLQLVRAAAKRLWGASQWADEYQKLFSHSMKRFMTEHRGWDAYISGTISIAILKLQL